MSIIFVSDLHLDESHPKIVKSFFGFLDEIAGPEHTLYILGDFFESWIGDDNLTAFTLSVIKKLHSATARGLTIYLMHGNRDFLLGKKFLLSTGCHLIKEQTVVSLYGVPTLLMHGDTLCTKDIKYLQFRKKARKWLFQQFFLLKSLKKRREIAAHYRAQSQSHVATLPDHIMDVTEEEVQRVMSYHHVHHLIHGHTHRQAIHHFNLHDQPAVRTVLGAWHTSGNALICESDGRQTFISI